MHSAALGTPAQAYPGRIPFLEFYDRFELLRRQLVQASSPSGAAGVGGAGLAKLPLPGHATDAEARVACQAILEAYVPAKYYQLGHSRVGVVMRSRFRLRQA